jgi:hypothetical protein
MKPDYLKYENAVRHELTERLTKSFAAGTEIEVYGSRNLIGKSGAEHQIDVSARIELGFNTLLNC